MPNLTLNQRLAVLALALGVVAIFASVDRGRTLSFHERDYATRIERTEDHVTVADLAAWILSGQTDYRLVDLRDASAYAEYHILTAENVPLATLGDLELLPTEKVILYSDGGIHASQGMLLLWAGGSRNAYTLLGGLDEWKEEVLFPIAPSNAVGQEQAAFERAVQVARFFGGQARAAATGDTGGSMLALETVDLPTVAPPAPGTGGARAPSRRKKKEGC